MKLRNKILLNAVLPLVLALIAIALTVRFHADSLAKQEQEVIRSAYSATKDAELKNYVELAKHAIAQLYNSDKKDEITKKEAMTILSKLEYGDDGYFFLLDIHGTMLMHPRLHGRVGEYMRDFKDAKGNPIIQKMISSAQKGGGFEDYVWDKPSSGSSAPKPKRAYVIELPNWGWILGTGVYLDDVDDALAEVDTKVSSNIYYTMLWIAAIVLLCAVIVFLSLMRNIRERTAMDYRLSEANVELEARQQRILKARDEERTRIENDLHDGVKQMLVAVKLKIETGVLQLHSTGEQKIPAQFTFESAAVLLKDTLRELTNIIRGIQPTAPLADLAQRLNQLTIDMANATTPIEFSTEGEIRGLTGEAEEALFRISQEALVNIMTHAAAHHASVRLESTEHCVKLAIYDDGGGFDENRTNENPSCGIGLRNMRERLESVGGQLTLTTSPKGTTVLATIPLH